MIVPQAATTMQESGVYMGIIYGEKFCGSNL